MEGAGTVVMAMRRALSFALVGMISGSISAAVMGVLLLPPESGSGLQLLSTFVMPGLVFGAAISSLLVRGGWLPSAQVAPWIFAAMLTYACAVLSAMGLTQPLLAMSAVLFDTIALTGLIAGAVGGGLLAGATVLLVPGTRAARLVAVGAVLGTLLTIENEWQGVGRYAFYVIWQGGYAATLAVALPEPRPRT